MKSIRSLQHSLPVMRLSGEAVRARGVRLGVMAEAGGGGEASLSSPHRRLG